MSAWLGFASPGLAQSSEAATCADGPARFLAIVVPDPSGRGDVDWRDVVRHVQSELQARGVRACRGAPGGAPFGWLELEVTTPERVRMALRFADSPGVSAERSLELGRIPADARSLSIAVAADELLASSWASVQRRVVPAVTPPRPTEPAPPPASPERLFSLGPSFAFDAFGGGQRWLGADARVGWRFAPQLALTLRVGGRQALPQSAPHGSVQGSALGGGLGIRLDLIQNAALTLALLGRCDAWRFAASAYAGPGAVAHEAQGLAVVVGGGPSLELPLSRRLGLSVEAAGGGVIRPVHVTDGGERVSGVSGWALSVAGGVHVAF